MSVVNSFFGRKSEIPFVGLRPFEIQDSIIFFGREKQIKDLLERLHKHHFLMVIGSSGCGKSSLIRAGLIPSLQAGFLVNEYDSWDVKMMKPGSTPLLNLVRTIFKEDEIKDIVNQVREDGPEIIINRIEEECKKNETNCFILIDQFEELFRIFEEKKTFEDRNDAQVFVRFLLEVFENGKKSEEKSEDKSKKKSHICEELFRIFEEKKTVEERNDTEVFVKLLLQAFENEEKPGLKPEDKPKEKSHIYVTITMRSDFIGDCDRFHGLPEALNEGQYLVPKLDRTQLRKTIESPIKLFGKKINSDLTSELLDDAQKTEDELPLLQHVLMRLWLYEKLEDKNGELDIEDYKSVGSLKSVDKEESVDKPKNALSEHVEKDVYNKLSNADKELTKKIFKSLTKVDEKGRQTRRPCTIDELIQITGKNEDTILKLVDKFIEKDRCFLVKTYSNEKKNMVIDISHESLIRNWGTLKKWVNKEAEDAGEYERLIESANKYYGDENGKISGGLLTGKELTSTRKWIKDSNINRSWAERYDKLFEKDYNKRNFNDADKYFKKSLYTSRRNKGSLLVAALIILGLGIGWVIATTNSSTNFSDALKEKLYNPTKALQLEDKALKYINFIPARITNWDLIKEDAEKILLNEAFYFYKPVIESPKDSFTAFAFNIISEKEYQVIAANKRGQIFLWKCRKEDSLDTSKPQITDSLKTPLRNDTVTCIAFSPDKTRVLTATQKGVVILYNIENDSLLTELQRFETDVDDLLISVAMSDTKIVTGSLNGKLRIWSIEENSKNFKAHQDSIIVYSRKQHFNKGTSPSDAGIISISFLPRRENQREEYVLVGALNDTVKLINCTDHKEIEKYTDPQGRNRFNEIRVVVSPQPDSTLFLTCGKNGVVNLWDYGKAINNPIIYKTAKPDKSFGVFKNDISAVAFSPDGGHFIISNAVSNNLSLYALNGNLEQELKGGHDDAVRSIAFSPDGKSVFTSSADNTVKIWRTNGKLITDKHADYQSPFTAAAIISDSAGEIITGDFNGFIEVFDAGRGIRERRHIYKDTAITCLAYSSESKLIFSSSAKGEITLTKYDGGKIGDSKKQNFRDNIFSAVFYDNGKKLLTGSINTIKLWSIEGDTLKFIKKFYDKKNQNFIPLSIDFSNTDSLLFVTGAENPGIARFWEINSDTPVGIFSTNLKESEYFQKVKFSRDGKKILVSTNKNYVYLLEYDKASDSIVDNKKIKIPVYKTDAVVFSFTGETLITGSGDGKIRYWDANTSKLITEFQADIEAIQSLELAKNGERLLSRSPTSVKLWNVSNPSFETFLEKKNIDDLKEEK
ncbi:MAG: AAA family ATPase [Agriterribacter sp.]